MNTVIVSAFPGCGKSHFYETTNRVVKDSDSSNFSKDEFPQNYIKDIKSNLGKYDIILVSSHKEVRDAMREAGLSYILVYPKSTIKGEYLKRYEERGSSSEFVNLLDKNWDNWMEDLRNDPANLKIELGKGKFLSSLFPNE